MKDNKHIQSFNEHQENLNISDVSDSDYTKDLSSVIDKYRQDFFEKIQVDIETILGDMITKKLTYPEEIYYEINNEKIKFFSIKFDKSEHGNDYCGIIDFDKDGYEFFKKSSLIKIFQSKKIL
jgi:hypothetical protein